MLIDGLQQRLFASEAMAPLERKLDDGDDASMGLVASVRPFLVAANFARRPRPTLVVVSGEEAAERFAHALSAYIGLRNVLVFPERKDQPWQDRAPDLVTVGARTRALGTLALGRPAVVVASARAMLRTLAPATGKLLAPIVIGLDSGAVDAATGEALEYEQVVEQLVRRGYERFEELDGPGTFAVHGDTVDVFGAGMRSPVRIEFFGDEVDGLRQVVASTGQSIAELDVVEIWPAREYMVSATGVGRARNELAARIATDRATADAVRMLEEGVRFGGMDRYLPYLYRRTAQVTEHVSDDALVVLAEPRSLFDDASRRYDELRTQAREAGVPDVEFEQLFAAPAKMDFGTQQRLTLLSIMRAGGTVDVDLPVERPNIAGREERLFTSVRTLVNSKVTTVFTVPDRQARADLELAFTDHGMSFVERLDSGDEPLSDEHLNIGDIDVASGFIIHDAGHAVVSIADLSARSARRRSRQKIDIAEVTFPFQPGDYVVHESHGIALFKGMVRQEVGGVERDYLLLGYAADDKLFVPVEQIDRITRYVGPEGQAPRLTRLNTADWSRAVTRARKSAKKLAFDLVDLYARRSAVKGFTYSPDSAWQEEMEAVFPYEETPDQLAAIADVKADMESDRPMDRLVCGDVGFGKTEVALRAAFKAVTDHRQVMVLCPTTILAQQHYTTFHDRFDRFGIEVEVLSRFRTDAQQRRALDGFAQGTVDVLVGTHRLLSRDVNPQNLGLVVIDEEQRFGVQHKEQLKNLRESVDVLTLSATPIPRTLQMSLSGVRDMSLITTPPPNRRPVKVHVGEWDEDVLTAAIRLEMERGGQAYYVSNRVRTIDDAVERVRAAAPEARVGVAHGQMSPAQVEAVMEQFSANEIDVLVATTIVESGLDNPHTNTLVIEDSQRLGLAQLYQLKGRVGRSSTQAYAYFLFPAGKPLTEEATARLEAIGEFTDLGSGMKVAMRDLEIRGAGTLLGADQSGNMSAVGFDLFASMLAQAVSDARGEAQIAHADIRVDLPLDFFIPEEYVPAADERVLCYRRLAAAETVEDVERVMDRMRSDYGGLPQPAANMCDRARAKALAAECGIESVTLVGSKLVFQQVPEQLAKAVKQNKDVHSKLMKMYAIHVPSSKAYRVPVHKSDPLLDVANDVLELMAQVARENR